MQVKALSRTRPQATVPNILRELLSNNMAIRMDPVCTYLGASHALALLS